MCDSHKQDGHEWIDLRACHMYSTSINQRHAHKPNHTHASHHTMAYIYAQYQRAHSRHIRSHHAPSHHVTCPDMTSRHIPSHAACLTASARCSPRDNASRRSSPITCVHITHMSSCHHTYHSYVIMSSQRHDWWLMYGASYTDAHAHAHAHAHRCVSPHHIDDGIRTTTQPHDGDRCEW